MQGSAGPSTDEFVKDLCKPLCILNNEPIGGSILKPRISLAMQIAKVSSVLRTVNNKSTFDENVWL